VSIAERRVQGRRPPLVFARVGDDRAQRSLQRALHVQPKPCARGGEGRGRAPPHCGLRRARFGGAPEPAVAEPGEQVVGVGACRDFEVGVCAEPDREGLRLAGRHEQTRQRGRRGQTRERTLDPDPGHLDRDGVALGHRSGRAERRSWAHDCVHRERRQGRAMGGRSARGQEQHGEGCRGGDEVRDRAAVAAHGGDHTATTGAGTRSRGRSPARRRCPSRPAAGQPRLRLAALGQREAAGEDVAGASSAARAWRTTRQW